MKINDLTASVIKYRKLNENVSAKTKQLMSYENINLYYEPESLILLEAYSNPDQELRIEFDLRFNENDQLYMEAIVKEKLSGDKVVVVTYQIGETLHIGNVEPIKKDPDKQYHTNIGTTLGDSTDVGIKGMKWIRDQLIKDANNRGYNVKQVTSSTRHSGARGKSKKVDQNVNLKIPSKK